MNKHIIILALAICISIPFCYSQTPKNKKSVIEVNDLDVIYDDDEYAGLIIRSSSSTDDDESYMYERTPLAPPPPLMTDPSVEDSLEMPHIFQSVDDEGVDSEEDILNASFDSETIHKPKVDISQLGGEITVRLLNEGGDGFSWPTPLTARPTSHFGPRRRRFHYGLDLATPKGDPIYAMWDGVVRISKYNKSYGNLIVISHNNGLETYYAHLSARHVTPGDVVKAGELIGLCGNTGRSYGSHLHLEIRYEGNAMNPENVINCSTHSLISPTLVLTKESFRKVSKQYASRSGSASGGNGGKSYYRVRSGDTLGKIAQRNGTTISKLCKLNGIGRNSTLQIGQKLKIR
ncbi:MAG: peptidoglycan DD-metalloendopeptidase family protein [Bacteroidales bacterium]|nr:peptidoglycan DD-metalloendopeptidase family protein [Candidatus Colimorpha onthohippi]